MIRTLSALTISAATALFATSALAQAPAPEPAPAASATVTASAPAATPEATDTASGGVSAALLVGYGTNSLNFGLGARGGYTLPMDMGPGHLYLGGIFQYFFGKSQSDGEGDSVGVSFWNLGVEGGYELPTGPGIVRPYVGLGVLHGGVSVSGPNSGAASAFLGGASSTNFAFTIGATGLYPVTPHIGVGVDLRFLIVSGENAFVPSLTGQYHF
jgi:hypothetical protein